MELNDHFWNFVESNAKGDPSQLRLKYHGKQVADFDIDFAITQIECRQKFAKKFADTLSRIPRFVFPSVLSGEQATSDLLAKFHAKLIATETKVVDLTSGLGIDALALSRKSSRVTAIEIEELKTEVLQYNAHQGGIENLTALCSDCCEFLEKCQDKYDVAFIDPARRSADGARVYGLADCKPDIIPLQGKLKDHFGKIIVKCSPMLDISMIEQQVSDITNIYVLGTTTECKELVAIIESGASPSQVEIHAVTLKSDGEESWFSYNRDQEKDAVADANYGIPVVGGYLYEPYPALMKAAPYFAIAKRYDLHKLHPNTHLYYSKEKIADFPGDVMSIIEVVKYESKHIKRLKSRYPAIRVATRNFDIGADALRKKLGVKDGGEMRLIAVNAKGGEKLMIIAQEMR